jgi:hypothetical protein
MRNRQQPWLQNPARSHFDMMFHLFCEKGYPLSLDKAARAGLKGTEGLTERRYQQCGSQDNLIESWNTYLRCDNTDLAAVCESKHNLE